MSSPARPDFSFRKEERIAKRAEFREIYESGQKHFGRHVIIFARTASTDRTRIGITATRKIGKAHDRNRLKRWVRETYRTHRASLGFDEKRLDVVINLKSSARTAMYDEFSADLVRTLRRALSVRPEQQAR